MNIKKLLYTIFSKAVHEKKVVSNLPIDTGGRHYKNHQYQRWNNFRHLGFMNNTNIDNKSGLPIPPPELMEYHEKPKRHLITGKKDFKHLEEFLLEHGIEIKNLNKVLEFGCSNSRVLRHFDTIRTPEKVFWGCDINADSILWCIENLSPSFNFFVNTTVPHLPISDNYFSFVYCYSIFTHIDDLFFTWLLELKRVIQKSGYLFITIHDEKAIEKIIAEPNRMLYTMFYSKNEKLFNQLMAGDVN